MLGEYLLRAVVVVGKFVKVARRGADSASRWGLEIYLRVINGVRGWLIWESRRI